MHEPVAIVGAGRMGRWHADAAQRAGARVAAVVDRDGAAAEALAARLRPRPATSTHLADCLASHAVVAAHICTPWQSHDELASLAVEAGCHVLVEKPLAATAAQTDALLEAARRKHVVVTAVHQFPFQRGVRRLLERRATLGDLVRVAWRTSSAGGAGRDEAGRRALLAEIVPHAASLFHRFAPGLDVRRLEVDLVGEALSVSGWSAATRLDAFISLAGRPPCNELVVTGTAASAVADLFHGYAVLDRMPSGGAGKAARPLALAARTTAAASVNGVALLRGRELAYPGLRELVRSFYASIRGGAPPPVAADELLAAAVLVDEVGRRVAVLRAG